MRLKLIENAEEYRLKNATKKHGKAVFDAFETAIKEITDCANRTAFFANHKLQPEILTNVNRVGNYRVCSLRFPNTAHRFLYVLFVSPQQQNYVIGIKFVPNHEYDAALKDKSAIARNCTALAIDACIGTILRDEEKVENDLRQTVIDKNHQRVQRYNGKICALLDKQLEIARLQPGAFTRARAGAGKTLILLEFLLGHLPGQRTLYFVNSAALCHNTKKSLPENFPQEGVEIARSEEIDRILCRQLPALILPEGVRLSNYDDFLRWGEQEELLQPPREASPKVKRATKIDFACLWAEFTHQIIRPNLADPKRQSPFLSRQEFEGQRDDESHTLKKDRPEIYTLFERYIQWLTENNLIESHIRKHALYLAVTAEKENDKDDVLLNLLFDRVASDEVQLQHDWDWYLSLSLLKNPHENWRMACDWNQCGRELRLKSSSRFRAACEYFGIENLHEFALNTNRRAGKKLVVLQDRLETLLENFWPSKGGEARPTEETSETPEETAAKNNDHSSIAHFTYDEFSKKNKPEGAVILVPSSVSDEKMQAIKSEFGQLFSLDKPYAEVYRANQVTGMEWRDVVLLGFDEALSAELDELNRYRNPETQDTENPIDRFVKIRGRRDADKITPPSQSAHYALVDLYMLTGRPTHSLTFISKKKHPFIDTIIEGLLQTPAEAQQAEIESAVVVMTKKDWFDRIKHYFSSDNSELHEIARDILCNKLWPQEENSFRQHLTALLYEMKTEKMLALQLPLVGILEALSYSRNDSTKKQAWTQLFYDYCYNTGLLEPTVIREAIERGQSIESVKQKATVKKLEAAAKMKYEEGDFICAILLQTDLIERSSAEIKRKRCQQRYLYAEAYFASNNFTDDKESNYNFLKCILYDIESFLAPNEDYSLLAEKRKLLEENFIFYPVTHDYIDLLFQEIFRILIHAAVASRIESIVGIAFSENARDFFKTTIQAQISQAREQLSNTLQTYICYMRRKGTRKLTQDELRSMCYDILEKKFNAYLESFFNDIPEYFSKKSDEMKTIIFVFECVQHPLLINNGPQQIDFFDAIASRDNALYAAENIFFEMSNKIHQLKFSEQLNPDVPEIMEFFGRGMELGHQKVTPIKLDGYFPNMQGLIYIFAQCQLKIRLSNMPISPEQKFKILSVTAKSQEIIGLSLIKNTSNNFKSFLYETHVDQSALLPGEIFTWMHYHGALMFYFFSKQFRIIIPSDPRVANFQGQYHTACKSSINQCRIALDFCEKSIFKTGQPLFLLHDILRLYTLILYEQWKSGDGKKSTMNELIIEQFNKAYPFLSLSMRFSSPEFSRSFERKLELMSGLPLMAAMFEDTVDPLFRATLWKEHLFFAATQIASLKERDLPTQALTVRIIDKHLELGLRHYFLDKEPSMGDLSTLCDALCDYLKRYEMLFNEIEKSTFFTTSKCLPLIKQFSDETLKEIKKRVVEASVKKYYTAEAVSQETIPVAAFLGTFGLLPRPPESAEERAPNSFPQASFKR